MGGKHSPSSFKKNREMLLIEHSENVISDEEVFFWPEENTSRNSEFSNRIYERFNLEEMKMAKIHNWVQKIKKMQ